MRVYVSGSFTEQARLRAEAARLHLLGHVITGTWLHENDKPRAMSYDDWMLMLGTKDVAEVFASEAIIMDLDGASTSGGRYTEWGVAVHPRSELLRYVVGGKKHAGSRLPYGCFIHLAHRYFDSWDDVISYFSINHAAR